MALTIAGVQESRVALGELWMGSSLLIPGTSDYVTGGYSVPAIQLSGARTIQACWVSFANATAIATWALQPLVTLAQTGTGTAGGFTGYTTVLFYAYVLSTGAQAASGANLTGAIWQVTYLFN